MASAPGRDWNAPKLIANGLVVERPDGFGDSALELFQLTDKILAE